MARSSTRVPAFPIAAAEPARSSNSTQAKPRGAPVSRSMAMRTAEITPHSSNAARSAASSTSAERFATKTVFVGFEAGVLPARCGPRNSTLMLRPPTSVPLSATAALASVTDSNEIRAKPRQRPLSSNVGTSRAVIVPHAPKSPRMEVSSESYGSPFTKTSDVSGVSDGAAEADSSRFRFSPAADSTARGGALASVGDASSRFPVAAFSEAGVFRAFLCLRELDACDASADILS